MAIRFRPNLPVHLLFPLRGFLPVDGLYGTQYLYQVEANGERDRLYACPKLHRALQLAKVVPGRVYCVTQVPGKGRRKEWLVRPASAPATATLPRPDRRSVAAVLSHTPEPEPDHDPSAAVRAVAPSGPVPLDRLLRLPLPATHAPGPYGRFEQQPRPAGMAMPRRHRRTPTSSRDVVQSDLPF
ncbi:MAG: hypothetical protein WDA75_12420 [Candidatus Latescibacterota bacterium]|jgi:hypothetical protein